MGKRSTSGKSGRTARTPAVRASAAGTARLCAKWARQFADDFYRPTHGGLTLSALALGTYLGESDDATDAAYAASVRAALTNGIDVVDTAINYRCQRSERTIGRALEAMIAEDLVRRDEVVICTKAGYIPLDDAPPPSREAYQRYVQREYLDPGILAPADIVAGGHSIAPKFLGDQLQRSLKNLRVGAVDCLYVHNPEQQLTAMTPDDFYRRMRSAFELLESCVAAGAMGAYGCATWNGLRLPAESQGHLSLFRLEALAREVAGQDHHFRFVQLPVNLSMSEAVRVSTQRDPRGRLVHVTDAAQRLGIDVVVSAPLLQGKLTEDLPESVRQLFPGSSDAQRALGFTRSVPGIVSVAVGARRVEHLEENLAAFHRPAEQGIAGLDGARSRR